MTWEEIADALGAMQRACEQLRMLVIEKTGDEALAESLMCTDRDGQCQVFIAYIAGFMGIELADMLTWSAHDRTAAIVGAFMRKRGVAGEPMASAFEKAFAADAKLRSAY